jgi:hypothetical protein
VGVGVGDIADAGTEMRALAQRRLERSRIFPYPRQKESLDLLPGVDLLPTRGRKRRCSRKVVKEMSWADESLQ